MPRKASLKIISPLGKILFFAGAVVLGFLAYHSYGQYKSSEIETEGIIVCGKDGTCEKSLHIHSALSVSICGKEQDLAKDRGELADIHTHKQSNVLHFHQRLKVTPEGEVLDWTPLKLANAVESVMGLKVSDECIGEFCNGAKCPNGKPGKLSLTVVPSFCQADTCPGPDVAEKAVAERGKTQQEIRDYVWQDGQLLRLTFE